jgi:NTE family protein
MSEQPEPVHDAKVASRDPEHFDQPEDGVALCLSGGGYRAMLFHLGALWRLNELGYLPRLARISSVSGGSITAAVLALAWPTLSFDSAGIAAGFQDKLVDPLRAFAGRTIDLPAIVLGILLPGRTISDQIAASYRRHLFGDATLQNLPDEPRFVVNATSLQSGVLFRFSKPYLWDYRVGEVVAPTVPLAVAVAASSAFPPILSPARLRFPAGAFTPGSGDGLQKEPYTRRLLLSDGGVYDNLGLETVWKRYKTILVSDGGGHLKDTASPPRDWLRQSFRVLGVIDNQVRSLRKRQVIDGYKTGARSGTYWGIRSHTADYQLPDSLPSPPQATDALAAVPTRLAAMPAELQERLINWGYAIADTALRRHLEPAASRGAFPYPRGL